MTIRKRGIESQEGYQPGEGGETDQVSSEVFDGWDRQDALDEAAAEPAEAADPAEPQEWSLSDPEGA